MDEFEAVLVELSSTKEQNASKTNEKRHICVSKQNPHPSPIPASQVKSSHLYLYSAFNNTNCNKALHNIKIGKLCQ